MGPHARPGGGRAAAFRVLLHRGSRLAVRHRGGSKAAVARSAIGRPACGLEAGDADKLAGDARRGFGRHLRRRPVDVAAADDRPSVLGPHKADNVDAEHALNAAPVCITRGATSGARRTGDARHAATGRRGRGWPSTPPHPALERQAGVFGDETLAVTGSSEVARKARARLVQCKIAFSTTIATTAVRKVRSGKAAAVVRDAAANMPAGPDPIPHGDDDGDHVPEVPEVMECVVERPPRGRVARVALLAEEPRLPGRPGREHRHAFGRAGRRLRTGVLARRGAAHRVDPFVDGRSFATSAVRSGSTGCP